MQEQIKELEMPRTLYDRVDGKMLTVYYDGEIGYSHFSGNEPWNCIKKMGLELIKPKKNLRMREHIRVKDLTNAEADIIGEMASEMIQIWNKYVKKVYEKEEGEHE